MRPRAALALLMLLAILVAVGCGGSSKTPAIKEAPVEESLSWKLAVVHQGKSVAKDDPLVGQFEMYLFLIEKKTTQNQAEVADILVKTWELLGKKVSLLDVFRDIDKLMPDTATKDLVPVAEAYIRSKK